MQRREIQFVVVLIMKSSELRLFKMPLLLSLLRVLLIVIVASLITGDLTEYFTSWGAPKYPFQRRVTARNAKCTTSHST